MKNNQEKLNDALGMVDESMVQSAMLHAEGLRAAHLSRSAMIRRRVAVVAAACLSMAFLAGAMLALPLLKADKPPVIVDTSDGEENFYVEAPIVKVIQLSATETAEISDSSIPTQEVDLELENYESFRPVVMLSIACQPSENVTLRASTNSLHCFTVEEDKETETESGIIADLEKYYLNYDGNWSDMHYKALKKFRYYLDEQITAHGTDTLTFDPSTTLVWILIPDSDEAYDEDLIEFTIQNEQGEITGAGSVYVVRKNVFQVMEDGTATEGVDVTRSAVLGSMRFTNPSGVTKEQVNELFEMLLGKLDACKEALDFTPTTKYEVRNQAENEIKWVVSGRKGEPIVEWYSTYSPRSNYAFFSAEQSNGMWYYFVILEDGTWAEYKLKRHANCELNGECHGSHDCPDTDKLGCHFVGTECSLTMTDGRILSFEVIWDGQGNYREEAILQYPAE